MNADLSNVLAEIAAAKRKDWDNADKPNWIYVNLTGWVEIESWEKASK